MFGCSNDDEETIIEPGDPDSPALEMFSDQFEGVDNITGAMFDVSFQFIDSIMSTGSRAPSALSTEATYSFTWVGGIGAWICTFADNNAEDSMTFGMVDTLKFYHGLTAVQYPDGDSVTQISHHLWLEVTSYGSGDDGGEGYLITTITRQNMSDTLIINGTGNIAGQLDYVDISGTDTTACAGTLDFDFNLSNIRLDATYLYNEDDEMNCPFAGSLVYTGAINIVCTGDGAGTLSGNWSVSQVFNDGLISVVIGNGINNWTMTDTCDTGGATQSDEFDSIFVDDLFDGPDMFMQTFQVLEITGLLMDSIPSVPGKLRPFAALSSEEMVISSVHSYSYTNGWHIFDFEAYVVDGYEMDTTYIDGVDSIQLRSGGTSIQAPAGLDEIDEIWERIHGGWESSTGDEWGAVHHAVDVEISSLDPDTIFVLSGTVSDTLGSAFEGYETGYCEALIATNQTVSGLTINVRIGGECPLAGDIANTTHISATCVSEGIDGPEYFAVNGTWIVTASVNLDGSITITYDGPLVDWSTNVTCGGDTAPGGSSRRPW
jgi:hypothetical protein